MSEKTYTFTPEEHEFLFRVCRKAKRIAEINIAPSYISDIGIPTKDSLFIQSLIQKLQQTSHV